MLTKLLSHIKKETKYKNVTISVTIIVTYSAGE
jgi:hypothetical protein